MGIWDNMKRRLDTARNLVDLEAGALAAERVFSRLDSIKNAWTGLGGAADKGQAGTVNHNHQLLSVPDLRWLTRVNQYAARYVEIFPDYALREGWTVADESDDMDPTADFDASLGLRAVGEVSSDRGDKRKRGITYQVAVKARQYGGCAVAVITNHQNPADPWGPHDREILNLVPLDPEEARPVEWYSDMTDPEFREPARWHIQPRMGTMSTSQNDRGVNGYALQAGEWHADRIIYVPGVRLSAYERLSNPVWYGYDDSVLQRAWTAIRQRTQDDQALSVLMQELSTTVIKIEGLAALSLTDQAEALDTRARAIARDRSLNQPILMGDGESVETLGANVSGVEHFTQNSRFTLSSAAGVPITIFFGDTPAGLNTDGESGRQTFHTAVDAYRRLQIAADFLIPLYMLAARTGQVKLQGKWSIRWPAMDEPSAKEKAETRLIHAQTDGLRIEQGVLEPEHVRRSRYGQSDYGEEIEPIDDSELEDDDDLTPEQAAALIAPVPDPLTAAAE